MTKKSPTVLDLFSGCGGMSWGLHKAGFRVIGAIDNWPVALKTFQHNHPDAEIFDGDIRDLSADHVMEVLGLEPGQLDVLVGGPPCQGFSKNVPAAYRFLFDERNQLFRDYMRFVEALLPKVVVMENVAELFNAYDGAVREEVCDWLASLGYEVEVRVVTASKYGVPQKRRRVIFLASQTGVRPRFPAETHGTPEDTEDALFNELKPFVSAWEAIRDLPQHEEGQGKPLESHVTKPETEFQEWARSGATEVTNHVARPVKPTQRARYAALLPGQGIKDLPPQLRPKSGYSGAYGRLDQKMVAPTITRWVFHPGSGRYGHPVVPRIITMREAARLQSFTDDFEFLGTHNDVAGQIGNAVPPLLMYAFAPEIRRLLGS